MIDQLGDGFPVVVHHGSPATGTLYPRWRQDGVRLIGFDRSGYRHAPRRRGRSVADVVNEVVAVADARGIDRFATWGIFGGGPHALACAAHLSDRVIATATLASVAPFTDAFDWFTGMAAPGALRSARDGREARERFALTDHFDENSFTPADWNALRGTWAPIGRDAGRAEAQGSEGLVDDDVAFAHSWGFEPADITVPVLIVQGGQDRVIPASHGDWLARTIRSAEFWLRPPDGHVSVMDACPAAMDWLRQAQR
jgi:pimeloyl-ACP methyl ester carboxylesterase